MNLLKNCIFFTISLLGGSCYAHVYDVDPINPGKEYMLQKEVFDRNNDNPMRAFPDFPDWLSQRDSFNARVQEWVRSVGTEIGYTLGHMPMTGGRWVFDTTQSQPAMAPENPMMGQRD